jgi:hypothetical protein
VKWLRLKGRSLGGASDETQVRSYELPARPLPHRPQAMRKLLPAFAGFYPADRSMVVDLMVREEPDEEEEEEEEDDDDDDNDDDNGDGYSE